MTTPPAGCGQFAIRLAFAEQYAHRVLRSAPRSATPLPETLYVAQLIATRGPGYFPGRTSERLELSRTLLRPTRLANCLARWQPKAYPRRAALRPNARERYTLHRTPYANYIAVPRIHC